MEKKRKFISLFLPILYCCYNYYSSRVNILANNKRTITIYGECFIHSFREWTWWNKYKNELSY